MSTQTQRLDDLSEDSEESDERMNTCWCLQFENGSKNYLKMGNNFVGRSGGNSSIVIEVPFVSNAHAVLTCKENGCFVMDMESLNGTKLNNIRIEPFERIGIKDSDTITFGNTNTTFRITVMEESKSGKESIIEFVENSDDDSVFSDVSDSVLPPVNVTLQGILSSQICHLSSHETSNQEILTDDEDVLQDLLKHREKSQINNHLGVLNEPLDGEQAEKKVDKDLNKEECSNIEVSEVSGKSHQGEQISRVVNENSKLSPTQHEKLEDKVIECSSLACEQELTATENKIVDDAETDFIFMCETVPNEMDSTFMCKNVPKESDSIFMCDTVPNDFHGSRKTQENNCDDLNNQNLRKEAVTAVDISFSQSEFDRMFNDDSKKNNHYGEYCEPKDDVIVEFDEPEMNPMIRSNESDRNLIGVQNDIFADGCTNHKINQIANKPEEYMEEDSNSSKMVIGDISVVDDLGNKELRSDIANLTQHNDKFMTTVTTDMSMTRVLDNNGIIIEEINKDNDSIHKTLELCPNTNGTTDMSLTKCIDYNYISITTPIENTKETMSCNDRSQKPSNEKSTADENSVFIPTDMNTTSSCNDNVENVECVENNEIPLTETTVKSIEMSYSKVNKKSLIELWVDNINDFNKVDLRVKGENRVRSPSESCPIVHDEMAHILSPRSMSNDNHDSTETPETEIIDTAIETSSTSTDIYPDDGDDIHSPSSNKTLLLIKKKKSSSIEDSANIINTSTDNADFTLITQKKQKDFEVISPGECTQRATLDVDGNQLRTFYQDEKHTRCNSKSPLNILSENESEKTSEKFELEKVTSFTSSVPISHSTGPDTKRNIADDIICIDDADTDDSTSSLDMDTKRSNTAHKNEILGWLSTVVTRNKVEIQTSSTDTINKISPDLSLRKRKINSTTVDYSKKMNLNDISENPVGAYIASNENAKKVSTMKEEPEVSTSNKFSHFKHNTSNLDDNERNNFEQAPLSILKFSKKKSQREFDVVNKGGKLGNTFESIDKRSNINVEASVSSSVDGRKIDGINNRRHLNNSMIENEMDNKIQWNVFNKKKKQTVKDNKEKKNANSKVTADEPEINNSGSSIAKYSRKRASENETIKNLFELFTGDNINKKRKTNRFEGIQKFNSESKTPYQNRRRKKTLENECEKTSEKFELEKVTSFTSSVPISHSTGPDTKKNIADDIICIDDADTDDSTSSLDMDTKRSNTAHKNEILGWLSTVVTRNKVEIQTSSTDTINKISPGLSLRKRKINSTTADYSKKMNLNDISENPVSAYIASNENAKKVSTMKEEPEVSTSNKFSHFKHNTSNLDDNERNNFEQAPLSILKFSKKKSQREFDVENKGGKLGNTFEPIDKRSNINVEASVSSSDDGRKINSINNRRHLNNSMIENEITNAKVTADEIKSKSKTETKTTDQNCRKKRLENKPINDFVKPSTSDSINKKKKTVEGIPKNNLSPETDAGSSSASSTPSTRNRSVRLKSNDGRLLSDNVFVMFTGLSKECCAELTVLVKRLGGKVTDETDKCTILVTDMIRRTIKFLCCVGKGIPIVTEFWIGDSVMEKKFLEPDEYLLKDMMGESTFSFSLAGSLRKARNERLFQDTSIFVTKSVEPPKVAMKSIIESCGGKLLARFPTTSTEKFFVVSCEKDIATWSNKKVNGKLPTVVTAEAILSGVLQQKIELEKFLLRNNIP